MRASQGAKGGTGRPRSVRGNRLDPDLESGVAGRLRQIRQRFTTNRRSVVAILASGRPMTLPEILGAGRHLAQSSVYRTLAILEEAQVVRRLPTSGGHARYELVEDLTEHHHHLVCSSCGVVEDLPAPPHLERTVRTSVADVLAAKGFTPRTHRLDVVGLCARCG